jgi:hypothetical protein
MEIIPIYGENHMKPTNKNADLLTAKAGGK